MSAFPRYKHKKHILEICQAASALVPLSCGNSLHSLWTPDLPCSRGWDSQPNHQDEVALGKAGSPMSIYNNESLQAQKIKKKLYRKTPIVKPPILIIFEKIGEAVLVEKCGVQCLRQTVPVSGRSRVGTFHWRALVWVKTPVLRLFEEVDFSISRPHKGSVNIVGDLNIGILTWFYYNYSE